MVKAIYCGLCISQSADEAHHGPSITGEGREGAMIDRVTSYAPIGVKPEGGGGVGHRVGTLTFSKENYQNPHPRAKKNCQSYQQK